MSIANAHEVQLVKIPKRVFFTANAKLLQGMGVCYDADRTETGVAATDVNARRLNHVEVPTTSNNRNFAGVSAETYTAQTGGRWITIYEPGSHCLVAVGADTVVNSTRLTCSCSGAAAGRFDRSGLPGRGTMIALQTTTSVRNDEKAGAGAIASQVITDTAAFANAVVGDVVVLLGGGVKSTGALGVLPNLHPISIVTDDDNVTVTTTAVDADAISYYTMVGENPKCQAYLEAGLESGLQEWVNLNDTPTNVDQSMVGGVTHIGAGLLTLGADSTSVLADPTIVGELKAFRCYGAPASGNYLVTVTSGLKLVGTALATLNFDATDENALLVGGFTMWKNISSEGATEA